MVTHKGASADSGKVCFHEHHLMNKVTTSVGRGRRIQWKRPGKRSGTNSMVGAGGERRPLIRADDKVSIVNA